MSSALRTPWLIRCALAVFPRAFRDAHAAEMEEDYAEARSKCKTQRERARLLITTAADLIVSGLRERGATRARSRLTTPSGDRHRERGSGLLEGVGAEARYALRALQRNPSYTAAAVVTLGLGIGANTAVFSVMDAVLLRPLPYAAPERLVLAGTFERGEAAPPAPSARYGEYLAWREGGRTLDAVGTYTFANFRVTGGREPVLAQALVIDAGLLPVLGVAPYIGGGFTPDLDVAGGAPAVLLSHEHWQSNFGADPRIVGGTIELNGQPYEVRGVLPAGFDFPPATRRPDGWLSWKPALYVPLGAIAEEIQYYSMYVVGRLADGATVEQATSEAAALLAPVAAALPADAAERDVRVVALKEAVVGPLRPAVLAFLGAVALVLLIACVNLGALMLARLSARERELGVRLALGAGRRRIARQLITESMVLAVLGGAAGVAIAALALRALVGAAPPELPGLADAALNARVLAFGMVATLAAGVLVGVLPALRASGGAAARLTGRTRGGVSERTTRRTHGVLVVAEVALAATLLVIAGLLIRSFGALAGVDAGFRHEQILTVDVSVPADRYAQLPDVLAYFAEVERRLAALPGVVAVSAVDRLPFGQSSSRVPVHAASGPTANAAAATALNLTARPGYLETMEIPLLHGRAFDARDVAGAQSAVVISRSLAERLWPEGAAVGQRVNAFGSSLEVVGVVGDVRHFGPAVEPEPMLYFTHATDPFLRRGMTLVVRTRQRPESVAPLARAEIRAVDPFVPVSDARSFAELRADKVAGERFNALLVGAFGALALLLVAVGIYGVMAFAIAHRTGEIGLRLALGASSRAVLGRVLTDAARLVALGLAIGLLAALPLARLLAGLLFGIEPLDPATFAGAAAIMALVGMLAALLPARRAARIEPLAALRSE